MRSKLEDLKELRDLVRSLGRGGGWGPLRRAPIQYLDMKASRALNLILGPQGCIRVHRWRMELLGLQQLPQHSMGCRPSCQYGLLWV